MPLTVMAAAGFGATIMTLAQEAYMSQSDTDSEVRKAIEEGTYQHGDMQRAVEAGKAKHISAALAVTRAERIDGRPVIAFGINKYQRNGPTSCCPSRSSTGRRATTPASRGPGSTYFRTV